MIDDHRTLKGYSTPTSTLFLPIMPVGRPCNIYREQLIALDHGHALWEPIPVEGLTIGDVGYVMDGFFHRMFNVTRFESKAWCTTTALRASGYWSIAQCP